MTLLFSIAMGLFALSVYAGCLKDVEDTVILYLCVIINTVILLFILGVLCFG